MDRLVWQDRQQESMRERLDVDSVCCCSTAGRLWQEWRCKLVSESRVLEQYPSSHLSREEVMLSPSTGEALLRDAPPERELVYNNRIRCDHSNLTTDHADAYLCRLTSSS